MLGHRHLSLVLAALPLSAAPALASASEPSRRSSSKLLTYGSPLDTTSSATINRWTGRPHEHKREISRRLRQQARRAEVAA